ncbi:MAG: hypothetical protein ACTSXD_01515 [Candidatus Heimdallarchaeaceae archaeon]
MKEDTIEQFFDDLIIDENERKLLSLLTKGVKDEDILEKFIQIIEGVE